MDVVNLKISKLGGLTKIRQARDLCVSMGIAMTLEDSWGGDIATAPGMDEGDGILCRDQEGIPLGERLGAEVMLAHPDQTRPLEGGYLLTDQRLDTDITGFGQQDGTEAHSKVVHVRGPLTHMGKGRRKPRAGDDLQ